MEKREKVRSDTLCAHAHTNSNCKHTSWKVLSLLRSRVGNREWPCSLQWRQDVVHRAGHVHHTADRQGQYC